MQGFASENEKEEKTRLLFVINYPALPIFSVLIDVVRPLSYFKFSSVSGFSYQCIHDYSYSNLNHFIILTIYGRLLEPPLCN